MNGKQPKNNDKKANHNVTTASILEDLKGKGRCNYAN